MSSSGPSLAAAFDSAAAGDPEKCEDFSGWWNVAFVGVPIVALAVNLVDDGVEGLPIGALILALFPATWFLFGRFSFRSPLSWWTFQLVLVALLTTSIILSPNTAILQALVYPFVWTVSSTPRAAVLANVAVAASVGVGFYFGFGQQEAAIPAAISITVLSFLFSLAFGLWMTRIATWGEERGRLLDELTAAQGELALAHREAGVVTERERISREVHDTLAQSLTGLVMLTQRATATASAPNPDLRALQEQLDVLQGVAQEALGEARAVVAASASLSADGGLSVAIARLAERVERETGLVVAHRVDAALTRELEVVLLRCAQEALANVRKHAGAQRASIEITGSRSQAVLRVSDDGRGISAAEAEGGGGFGLTGMRERLALVGGSLLVSAAAPHGTVLEVIVPIETTPDRADEGSSMAGSERQTSSARIVA